MKLNYHFGNAHHHLGFTFPDGNRKQDGCVSIAFAPDHTCPDDAPCKTKGLCYFIKEGKYFTSVAKSAAKNWKNYLANPERFWKAVDKALTDAKNEGVPFRWFEGGDIPSYEFFCRMMDKAKANPGLCHGMTKQYGFVNRYIAEHGGDRSCVLNFIHLRFSRWKGYPMDNPFNMPEFSLTYEESETTCLEQRSKMKGVEWSCMDCYLSHVGCYSKDHRTIHCIDHNVEASIVKRRGLWKKG